MGKPNLTRKSSKRYNQGKFKPKNPEKYIGNVANIVFRSKWELQFLKWLDTNKSIVKYGSEEIQIPYYNDYDEKEHIYYPDFIVYTKQNDGSIRKAIIEIKPYKETIRPKISGKILSESARYQVKTYITNQCKWKYARRYCKKINADFIILTEKQLFNE